MNFFSQKIWLSNTRKWLSLLRELSSWYVAHFFSLCEFHLEPNCFSRGTPSKSGRKTALLRTSRFTSAPVEFDGLEVIED